MQTDPGDTRLNNYFLEHSLLWIAGNPNHARFWDPPFYFPAVNIGAYSDIFLSSAPVYWLFRLMGFLPDTAFQLWMPVMAFLDFLAAFLLFRKGVGVSYPAAIGGSYVFAFSGIRANQLNVQQLLPQFFSAMAILCLFKIFDKNEDEGKEIWIVGFALSLVLQLYTGFYLVFFLCFGLLVALAVALAFRESRSEILSALSLHKRAIVISFLLAALLAIWPAIHYMAGQGEIGARKWNEISSMIPQLKSWLNTGPENLIYKWTRNYIDFSKLPAEAEHRLCPGPLTFIVALIGFVSAFKLTWVRIVAISSVLIAAVAFLYTEDWSPWAGVLWFMPGAGAIRAVARVSFLLLIALSMGVALFLNGLRRQYLLVILVALIAMEQVQTSPAYNKEHVRAEVSQIAKHIPGGCKSFYFAISLPVDKKARPWFEYQLDGMWAGLNVGIPTVNGFSGNLPPDWWPLWDPIVKSSSDLTKLHLGIFRWADTNRLPVEDICMVPVFSSDAPKIRPEFGPLDLKMGQAESRLFLGDGWGDDEWDRDLSWVWTTGRSSTMYIPLQEGVDHTMQISVAPIVTPGRIQEMNVRLNGSELAKMRLEKGSHKYRIPISSALVKEFNKVEFTFSYAASPASTGQGADTRQLAAAFERILFLPSGNQESAR